MNIDRAEWEIEYFYGKSQVRLQCVVDTLGFAETNCSESKSACRIYSIGQGKYRLPLAEILILRPGDQN
jgi:hypothetical protein